MDWESVHRIGKHHHWRCMHIFEYHGCAQQLPGYKVDTCRSFYLPIYVHALRTYSIAYVNGCRCIRVTKNDRNREFVNQEPKTIESVKPTKWAIYEKIKRNETKRIKCWTNIVVFGRNTYSGFQNCGPQKCVDACMRVQQQQRKKIRIMIGIFNAENAGRALPYSTRCTSTQIKCTGTRIH